MFLGWGKRWCRTWLGLYKKNTKGSPYSITELIPVLGSQPAGDASHKPDGRLPILFARNAERERESCYRFCCLVNRGTTGVNGLPIRLLHDSVATAI